MLDFQGFQLLTSQMAADLDSANILAPSAPPIIRPFNIHYSLIRSGIEVVLCVLSNSSCCVYGSQCKHTFASKFVSYAGVTPAFLYIRPIALSLALHPMHPFSSYPRSGARALIRSLYIVVHLASLCSKVHCQSKQQAKC